MRLFISFCVGIVFSFLWAIIFHYLMWTNLPRGKASEWSQPECGPPFSTPDGKQRYCGQVLSETPDRPTFWRYLTTWGPPNRSESR